MNNDLMTQYEMTVISCSTVVISNRSLLKSLALAVSGLFFVTIFMMQPIPAWASDFLNTNQSSEQILSQLKDRLKLTEDQETKVRPIIEASVRKRNEILINNTGDGKSLKSALQEVQWSTNMQLGKILTEQQMKEYQELLEAKSDKLRNNDIPHGKGTHTGGTRSF
jgi:hypothetical protein